MNLPLSIESTMIDSEYIILENIYDSAKSQLPLRQRELAQIAGASLGMTNSILKRLAQKGWITVKKLNSRNIQYAVTLEGINEIIRRSYRYFKRTIKNVVYYKEIIENLVYGAKIKKITSVRLVGNSDLDFIIEHACRRCGLRFFKNSGGEKAVPALSSGDLIIYAEGITENVYENSKYAVQGANHGEIYLSGIIMKQPADLSRDGYDERFSQ